MPIITIDGVTIEAKEGQTIIEAAYNNGIEVPHFCWHPGLSVSGNCRMCLSEVGTPKRGRDGSLELDADGKPIIAFFPKLQIACSTPISDGMHVRIKDKKPEAAQEAVMEFILINHPLDCPICDEAGQCKLQEYGFKHSKGESRFEEHKNHKEKRHSLGPNVLFDGERCISCSRCIRFAEEVAKQPAITFIQRGDKVTIDNFPGETFDSPYSMNVIDICPVGALTSPDFRFKSRVWDMSFNETICQGCSRGCNIKAGVRNNEILRLEPRTNMYVNEYWMCDEGRLTQYDFVNKNRIEKPSIKKDGVHSQCEWNEAVATAAEKLRKFKPDEIMVVGSARATNEDNFALAKFARNVLKTQNIDFVHHVDAHFGDSFLRRQERSSNSAGANLAGVRPDSHSVKMSQLAEKISSGKIKALYVMEEDISLYSPMLAEALEDISFLVVHASNHNSTTARADVVFASATFAELEGTYTNFQQRVQYVSPVIVTAENERHMGMNMSRLDKMGAWNDRWTDGARRNCRQSWRILQALANQMGASWKYKSSEDVFAEIAQKNDGFKGMNYDLLQERQGIILGKVNQAEPPVMYYESHVLKPN